MALSYPRILIAAGEHSGDRFGARLARALRELRPDVCMSGVGGPQMAEAGVHLLAGTTGHASMGFLHPILNAADWARVFRHYVGQLNREPPDILVPIDNPGFNLKLAHTARERGIPVCYYVSPQVWAWRPGRIHKIARLVTRMMVILPFEKALYDRVGVDCEYVGHPLLDYMTEATLDPELLGTLQQESRTVIGILPGSRTQEILHTFPIICDAALLIRKRLPETVFHIAAATPEHLPRIEAVLNGRGLTATVHTGRTPEVMKASRLCLTVSGTATLETAYYRTPMVIVYRAGWLARHLAPRFLRVPHISLVNIIAGREVAPEFLKFDDDPRPIAAAALDILTDAAAWEQRRAELDAVINTLGPAGSSARAARAVLECLNGSLQA